VYLCPGWSAGGRSDYRTFQSTTTGIGACSSRPAEQGTTSKAGWAGITVQVASKGFAAGVWQQDRQHRRTVGCWNEASHEMLQFLCIALIFVRLSITWLHTDHLFAWKHASNQKGKCLSTLEPNEINKISVNYCHIASRGSTIIPWPWNLN